MRMMQVVVERRGELLAECGDMNGFPQLSTWQFQFRTHALSCCAFFHGLTWKARRALILLARIQKNTSSPIWGSPRKIFQSGPF